jgi:hypothetical protein
MVLRNLGCDDREALWQVPWRRQRGAVKHPFWRVRCTSSETFGRDERQKESQPEEFIEKDVGGPTWIRTRDQPVMSRWL